MSESTKALIAVEVCNVLKVAIFALLAFTFNKWWIVLFSALVISTFKSKEKGDENDIR